MKKLIPALSMLLGALTGCSLCETLSVEDFAALLDTGQAFLLDVRTPEEYAEGHLPGAANADWYAEDFLQQVEQLCPKDRELAIYCRTGKRAAQAAKALSKAGYTVKNLQGGFFAWRDAGKEVQLLAPDDPDLQYAGNLLAVGTAVPDFTLNDIDGKPVRLSDFRGKSVVLLFWASWCPDCRGEVPLVKAMHAAADPDKVSFVSVSFDRALADLQKYVAENDLPGVQLFDPAGKKDSAVGSAYGVGWIPSLYLIDPEGKVVLGTVVAQKVAAMLQGKSVAGIRATLGNLCSDESCLIGFSE